MPISWAAREFPDSDSLQHRPVANLDLDLDLVLNLVLDCLSFWHKAKAGKPTGI